MKDLRVLLRFIHAYRGKVLGTALLGTAALLCEVGLLASSAFLIAKAAIVPAVMELMAIIALVRFFGLFRAAFRYGERLLGHDVTLRVLRDLRGWYFRRLIPLLPGALGNAAARIFKNIIADIETLQYFYLRVLATPLVALLVLLSLSIFLGSFLPVLLLPFWLAYLLQGFVLPLICARLGKRNAALLARERQDFYRYGADFLQTGDELWFLAQRQKEKVKKSRVAMGREERRARRLDAQLAFLCSVISAAALFSAFYLTAQSVEQGALAATYLVALPLVVWSGLSAVSNMPLAMRFFFDSRAAMTEMLVLVAEPARGREQDCQPQWQPEGLRFSGVRFAYLDRTVLDDVSFTVQAGEKALLLGEIGSGKSSILDLLLGFYRQDAGEIRLDGISLADCGVPALGAHIAVLRQESAIFAGSIRENLCLAAGGTDPDDTALYAALDAAGLGAFVRSLPDGLDHVLQEGGSNLSGGEKRRIELARLFLQDKPLILADEPLEGLDEETGKDIQRTLLAYAAGRTLLYVSHDRSVCGDFDQVLELRDGRISVLPQG